MKSGASQRARFKLLLEPVLETICFMWRQKLRRWSGNVFERLRSQWQLAGISTSALQFASRAFKVLAFLRRASQPALNGNHEVRWHSGEAAGQTIGLLAVTHERGYSFLSYKATGS